MLDECSVDASALWLDAWSLGRRNAALAEVANALTDEWLAWIADIVRAGVRLRGNSGAVTPMSRRAAC